MRLKTADNVNGCVAASLAMVLDMSTHMIERDLFLNLETPFSGEWSECPKVPDMNVIVHWAWDCHRIGFVPFEYNPQCSPHPACPEVPVWPHNAAIDMSADTAFDRALGFGPGLLEGDIKYPGEHTVGHMCAWDGNVIYDPKGYVYSRNVSEKFGFVPLRFWLMGGGK
jgi:hypothetical protein